MLFFNINVSIKVRKSTGGEKKSVKCVILSDGYLTSPHFGLSCMRKSFVNKALEIGCHIRSIDLWIKLGRCINYCKNKGGSYCVLNLQARHLLISGII